MVEWLVRLVHLCKYPRTRMDRHIGFGGLEKQLRFGDGRDKRADDVTTAAGQAERESAPLARLRMYPLCPPFHRLHKC